jgi:hypothetical protein
MTHDSTDPSTPRDAFADLDPWAVLQDGRRQLLAALDACDASTGALALAIPEFAALGESTGTVTTLLLAHAARERDHAAFFASLDASAASEPDTSTPAVAIMLAGTEWSEVRDEVVESRVAMLEAVGSLSSEYWEQRLRPPWPGAGEDSLAALLLVRAMSDGMLADAIHALLTPRR